MDASTPQEVLANLQAAGTQKDKYAAMRRASVALKRMGGVSDGVKKVLADYEKQQSIGYSDPDVQMAAFNRIYDALLSELNSAAPGVGAAPAPGGRRRRGKKTRKGQKTRKGARKGGRKTRKLRGRGLLDMFSRSKKLDSGLAGGVVPAGEIVSAIEGARGGDINVSSVFAYDRGLKLLEAITATNTSKYKKGYTLVQELARNSGKVTLRSEIGQAMHTEGVFDPDDVQQAASELRTALSNYKPETGEVV